MDRCKLMGRRDPTPPKPISRKAQRSRGYPDHPPAPAALACEAEVRVPAESTPRFSLRTAQEIERRAGDQRANGRYPSSPVDIWRGPQNALNAVSWQYTGPDPVSVTRRSTDMCLSVAARCRGLPSGRTPTRWSYTRYAESLLRSKRTLESRLECPIRAL